MPRVSLHTLGCKLNYAETSSIGRQFADKGFAVVEFGTPADVCVINTCTVTARADRECRQIIRRARRTSPGATIVVTGCYAQLEPERIAAIQGVDLVLGTREKFRMLDHLAALQSHGCARILVSPVGEPEEFGPAFSSDVTGRTRAFLKVQDGCDYTCTFCTIPLARGAARSQSIGACVEQARLLVGQGFREIVLTGVNVGEFGVPGADLADLLSALESVPGLERLRISSIEPNLLTGRILNLVAESPVICNHFHVPLQSGSDAVLRRMKRRYTSAMYQDLIGRIIGRIPDCGIGADVIVGFPGESESDFEETRALLQDLPLTYLHVFTYSERAHTPAAAFASPVPLRVRHERNERLRHLGEEKRSARHAAMIGRTERVLMEGTVADGLRFGLTEHYVRVGVPADGAMEHAVMEVELLQAGPGYCLGRPVCGEIAA